MVGPAAQRESWKARTEKLTTRLQEWPWSKLGFHFSLRIYNTFILPTLFFTAQLQRPPTFASRRKNTKQHRPGSEELVLHG